MSSTPVSINNGTWDVKKVLGSVPVKEDGSALFEVPALTPVYFQLLDEKNHVIQSMRSWSTLQPGESLSCVGCHEHKSGTFTPPAGVAISGASANPEPLQPFYGSPRGFSFAKEVQPIFDKHCVSCHDDRSQKLDVARSTPSGTDSKKAFSLLDTRKADGGAKRLWSDSYLALTQNGKPNRLVKWLNVQSVPSMLPPYFAGAAKSELITLLDKGHYDVELNQEEMDKIACWIDLLVPFCGDYTEAATWNDAEKKKYAHFEAKRERWANVDRESYEALATLRAAADGTHHSANRPTNVPR
jgi:hypothetical protein